MVDLFFERADVKTEYYYLPLEPNAFKPSKVGQEALYLRETLTDFG